MEMRPIPSCPGYYAGNDGVIYSTLYRWRKSDDPPRPLSSGRTTKGYHVVNPVVGGRAKSRLVHALVCEAFHGPRPPGTECSHHDDDKDHNSPDNLSWETKVENHARRAGNGISDTGSRNSRASLNHEQVVDVRSRLRRGEKHQDIADIHGVARTTITRINCGQRYAGEG